MTPGFYFLSNVMLPALGLRSTFDGIAAAFYRFFIPIYSLGRHSAKSSYSQIFPHEAVKFKSCSFRDAMPCFLLD